MFRPIDSKLRIKIAAVAIVALLILGYAYYSAFDLIQGPTLHLQTPQNGATVDSSLIHIRGKAQNSVALTLNGREMLVDEDGIFDEQVLLSYGYNAVTIAANDRFGKTKRKTLELIYK